MTTDPTSPQSLPEVAQLAVQNRRDIAALSETFSGFAERITAAHEQVAQTLTDLIQDNREQRAQAAELTAAQQRTDASIAALTDGLNELRAQVAELTAAQRQTNDRLARLEDQLSALTGQVSRLTEAQQQTSDRVTRLEDQLSALTSQVSRLTEAQQQTSDRVTRLEDQLSALTGQVSRLAEAQQQTNDRATEMNGRLTTLSGRVANLTGGRYEKEASRLAQRHIRRLLDLPNTTITHSSWSPGDVVAEAVNSDNITDTEAEDLNRADLVIAGQNASGDTIHALAEISATIQPYDVARSSARAAILRKALGQTVHAAVVGSSSTPEAIAMAERCKVIILTIPAPTNEN